MQDAPPPDVILLNSEIATTMARCMADAGVRLDDYIEAAALLNPYPYQEEKQVRVLVLRNGGREP